MPEIKIRDLTVNFPYEPYDIQKDYMEKVIECLQMKSNGVLESPTGSGKTLCLLCSSLAWLCGQKAVFQLNSINPTAWTDNFMSHLQSNLHSQVGVSSNPKSWNETSKRSPKVVYASRTHSQLNQVMLELKKTSYRYLKVGILGSRDQLCIHPVVSQERNVAAQIHMCKTLTSSRTCPFYNNVETRVKEPLFQEDVLVDIEDLVKKGKKTQCCPYYASRELQNDADILFAPYNYLLDSKTRRAHDMKLQDNVIILDEAHNVEKVCEESSSSQLSSTTIAICISEITAVMKTFTTHVEQESYAETNVPKDFSADELVLLKTLFMVIEKSIDQIELTDKNSQTFKGSHIFNILNEAQITLDSVYTLLDTINKVSQFLMNSSESQLHQKGGGLLKFCEFLEIVFASLGPEQSIDCTDSNYRLYVEPETPKVTKGSSWSTTSVPDISGKVLNFWCFNPGFGMRSLLNQGVHCIILTSGTLSPLDATISEIGIPVNVQLSNEHIIKSNQISVVVVEKGPGNNELRCVYQNRTNMKYIMDLGQTCLNFYRIVPGGVLVFFPSYPFLKSCVEYWQQNGIWNRMAAIKSIFTEPQNKDELKSVIEEYYKMVDERGASLFAVCRGKVSEGLDFADAKGRAVIVIGLPYPPFNNPKVLLKREYLDSNKKKNLTTLDGNDWYQLEAVRAVNQAIGRVIRHVEDYGAVIFCDSRFSYPSNIKSLSKWLQPHIVSSASFGQALKIISNFFKLWKDTPSRITFQDTNNAINGHQTNRTVSAQKLAPSSSCTSSKIDYVKLYEASTSNNNTKVTVPVSGFKRKSVLELLEDCESVNLPKEEVTNNTCESLKQESTVPIPQAEKKRKLNIKPIQLDGSSKVNGNPETETRRFTLQLQKNLNSEQMNIFKEALIHYRKTSDDRSFVSKTAKLFLSTNNKELRLLFREIPFFLKTQEHKDRFWESYNAYVNKNCFRSRE